MKNKILAIYDREEKYAAYFMDYVNGKKNSPFRALAFSKLEKLKEYAAGHEIEILLAESSCMEKEVEELTAAKVMILSSGEVRTEYSGYQTVYKYQSSERILQEILCYYAEVAEAPAQRSRLHNGVSIIGIYSPIRQVQRTSFAFALGSEIAKKKNTLYINLEDYSGFDTLLGRNSSWDLADLMYFMREKKTTFLYKLGSVIQTRENLDFITPMSSPLDIRSIKSQEWEELFSQLARQSDYEVLLVDFGDYVDNLFELLNQCKKVYTPIRRDRISMAKILQYEELLGMMDFEMLLKKTQQVELPLNESILTRAEEPIQLVWPGMQKFVEDLNIGSIFYD